MMNKKLVAGLMSVVMLAGSCPTLGAHGVGKSKVSNNSVVRFVKNHKKIIVGMLVVGAGAGVGYYKREEVKKGFNTAKDKIKDIDLTPLKEGFNKVKGKVNSLIKSKPAENTKSVENLGSIGLGVGNLNQGTKDQVGVQEVEAEAEANEKSVKDAPASEPESLKSATGSKSIWARLHNFFKLASKPKSVKGAPANRPTLWFIYSKS
ncbi:MAG: hypothetical protein ACI4PR_00085 [Acutalibacteraceae bacterium]